MSQQDKIAEHAAALSKAASLAQEIAGDPRVGVGMEVESFEGNFTRDRSNRSSHSATHSFVKSG